MPVTIKTFEDEPYMLATYYLPIAFEDLDMVMKTAQGISEKRKAQGLPSTVWLITDSRETKPTFDEIVNSLGVLRKLASEDIRPVVVGTDEMVVFASKALEQKQYGSWEEIKIFSDVEQALAFAKAQSK
jgi:hypothetical protein